MKSNWIVVFSTELPARYQAIKGAWIPVALGADHGQPGAPALTLDPSGSPGYIVHVCLRGFSCLNRGTRVLHTTYHHISTKFKNISTTHHWFNDNYTPSDRPTWWITHFFPHSLFSVFPFLLCLSKYFLKFSIFHKGLGMKNVKVKSLPRPAKRSFFYPTCIWRDYKHAKG